MGEPAPLRRARVVLPLLGYLALFVGCAALFVVLLLLHAWWAAAAAGFVASWIGTVLFCEVTDHRETADALTPLFAVGCVAALVFTLVRATEGQWLEALVGLLLTLLLGEQGLRCLYRLLPAGTATRDRLFLKLVVGALLGRLAVAAVLIVVVLFKLL